MTPARRIFSEKQRLIWPLIVVLAANAAMFALVVYPLSQKVAVGEDAAAAASAALANAQREHANARATVSGMSEADAELARFYKEVLPPDLSGARRITFLPLEQLAKSTNLRLERQTADSARVRGSDLHKFSQTAVLTGEYRDVRRFIHQIETGPAFIILENVSLAQSEADQSRGITVTVQIATYYRTVGDGN